jgi:hypothetical protein
MMKRLRLASIAAICATLGTAVPAVAKDKPVPPSPLVAAIDRCRHMTDPAQRLACYDSASAALVNASNSGEVSVVDRGEVRKVRRSLFGFSMPRIPFFSGDTTANEAQSSLDSTITSVRALNNGYYRIVIADNNAVWETTDSSISFDPPRPGQKITILRGPLGSYFLRINGQNGVRGHRVG